MATYKSKYFTAEQIDDVLYNSKDAYTINFVNNGTVVAIINISGNAGSYGGSSYATEPIGDWTSEEQQ